jgi:hypothetical protein
MTKNKRVCPQCQSKKVIPIIYGMPTEETFNEAESGKVILGGCCISEGSPEWHCTDCEYQFGN